MTVSDMKILSIIVMTSVKKIIKHLQTPMESSMGCYIIALNQTADFSCGIQIAYINQQNIKLYTRPKSKFMLTIGYNAEELMRTYDVAVTTGNYKLAISLALELILQEGKNETTENFLEFSRLCEYRNSTKELAGIVSSISRTCNSFRKLNTLLKLGITQEDFTRAICRFRGDIVDYYLVLKNAYCMGYCIPVSVDILLSNLDSFDIYEQAIARDDKVPFKRTSNYLWYKLHKNIEIGTICEVLNKTNSISDIDHVCELIQDSLIEIPLDMQISKGKLLYVQNRLNITYCDETLGNTVKELISKPCNEHINVLCVISVLLESMKETDIIICLFIAQHFRDFPEIKIVTLALYRHFLYLPGMVSLFHELEFRSCMLLDSFYIWSDVFILLKQKPVELIETYQDFLNSANESLISYLITFISTGDFDSASDLLMLKNKIRDNPTLHEIYSNTLNSEPCESSNFRYLLGIKNASFFEKRRGFLRERSKDIIFDSINSFKTRDCTESLSTLSSSYGITYDSDFMKLLSEIYEYQSKFSCFKRL